MAFAAVAAAGLGSPSALAVAPYIKADKAITDEQGRIHVTIDFSDGAPLSYPHKLTLLPRTKQDGEGRPIEFPVGVSPNTANPTLPHNPGLLAVTFFAPVPAR